MREIQTAVLTPTNGRPEALALLARWLDRQEDPPEFIWYRVSHHVLDLVGTSGETVDLTLPKEEPGAASLLSLLTGLLTLIQEDGIEQVIVCEDDDWYGPHYLVSMVEALRYAPLVGQIPARYYHLPTGGYATLRNTEHASLAQTAFRAEVVPTLLDILKDLDTPWIDVKLWKEWKGESWLWEPEHPEMTSVGMKALPGRPGIGIGHDPTFYKEYDTTRNVLWALLGKDAGRYLELISTPAS